MLRDRTWIASHIPHQGSMCLLDEVLHWDEAGARCRSWAHRSATNPLRAHGRLSSVCAIEFAAQAMAVHGALVGANELNKSQHGYLVSIRGVDLHTPRLDNIEEDLLINVDRIGGDETTVLYQFAVYAAARLLVGGRAAIVLDPAAIEASVTRNTHESAN